MKNILFFIFLLSQFLLNAQDTIYKRSGEVVPAKIYEININEISYRRSDLLDGPLFISSKNDIKKIKYNNGAIDSFIVVKEVVEKPVSKNRNPVYVIQNYTNDIQPTFRKGIYMYQGQQISDGRVVNLALEKNLFWKNDDINYFAKEYKKCKTLQYSIGFGGAAVGAISMTGSLISTTYNSSSNNDNAISAVIFAAGTSVLVASQIISASFKFRAIKHSNKLAELFNQFSRN